MGERGLLRRRGAHGAAGEALEVLLVRQAHLAPVPEGVGLEHGLVDAADLVRVRVRVRLKG